VLVTPGRPWVQAASGRRRRQQRQRDAKAAEEQCARHHAVGRLLTVSDSRNFCAKRSSGRCIGRQAWRMPAVACVVTGLRRQRVQCVDLAGGDAQHQPGAVDLDHHHALALAQGCELDTTFTTLPVPKRCSPKRRAAQAHRKIRPSTIAMPKAACSTPPAPTAAGAASADG
jgi:hypothetical protein